MFARYTKWLHTQWPAGVVEKLPEVSEDGTTVVPGVRVVGDLTGIPLLKFAADSGAKAVRAILAEPGFRRGGEALDLVILGGGVAGIAAALEAKRAGLRFEVIESARAFSTIANFPARKPIFTYPTEMVAAGELALTAEVKETLFEELEAQREKAGIEPTDGRALRVVPRDGLLEIELEGRDPVRAQRVIVAIGRSGDYRTLGVPGEDLPHVSNRLLDARDSKGEAVLVVGGGDSAVEAAIALSAAGARVVLSHRKPRLTRPKPENLARLAALGDRVTLLDGSTVKSVTARQVELEKADGTRTVIDAGRVFVLIGRAPPLEFFRRSGIPIRGEWRAPSIASFIAFLLFCTFVYNWKSGGALTGLFKANGWFPFQVHDWLGGLTATANDPSTLLGTLAITLEEPGFYYSLAYSTAIVVFGIQRIRRRQTPYVTWQTVSLMAIQLVPLFILPYVLLPWAGHNGLFDHGFGKLFADNLFPVTEWSEHGREYWRSFGFILAWPLFIWNLFTEQPMTWWLVIACVQTFVILPAIVWRWGKGAYCGWICSCGALAETLGDTQRTKMPHGPFWNRLNMLGQAILAAALLLFAMRVYTWSSHSHFARQVAGWYRFLLSGSDYGLDYYHLVDIGLAGIVGVGCYFWLSGRVWCRFACPLAALMHIYARFSAFRIFADKKKCISCGVCTSVCHQGIDVMAFAQVGAPMEDPQCVRCSACVQGCPTGTLSFGRVGAGGAELHDTLLASPVQRAEGKRRLPLAA